MSAIDATIQEQERKRIEALLDAGGSSCLFAPMAGPDSVYATAAQGAKADTAIQPLSTTQLATLATVDISTLSTVNVASLSTTQFTALVSTVNSLVTLANAKAI